MTGTPVPVTVKWSKQKFPDIRIDPTESPQLFKSQLWTLTGVPPDRQTVLGLKGGKLKDDADWSTLGLKANMTLMLLGTPDESRVAPPQKLPSVRDDLDLDDDESYDPPVVGPPGLANLGNTCYVNATVQCLNAVEPLVSALSSFRGSSAALDPSEKVSANLRDVLSRLKSRNSASVTPTAFLAALREVNPQFAERAPNGVFMQQDAEECFGELLTRMASALKIEQATGGVDNHIDELFAVRMRADDKCEESDEVVHRSESVRALKCHISLSVNHLKQGVSEGLEETIEKHSDVLGRSAKWRRVSRMESLPPFLIVQFVRFFWKPTERVKAKILRNVSFPIVLDVFDFCTEGLKDKMLVKRDEIRAGMTDGEGDVEVDVEGDNGSEIVAESGNYELCAILTHQGRAADAGHYVSWVKDTDEKWFKFDDDKVDVQTQEDVQKLSGGGDWHMAYICVYRATNKQT